MRHHVLSNSPYQAAAAFFRADGNPTTTKAFKAYTWIADAGAKLREVMTPGPQTRSREARAARIADSIRLYLKIQHQARYGATPGSAHTLPPLRTPSLTTFHCIGPFDSQHILVLDSK